MNFIKQQIQNSINAKQLILSNEELLAQIQNIANTITSAYKNNNKVLLAGNGGSASDCQHIACELVSKISVDRRALGALALTTNTSILTAISNDFNFNEVFSRQIEALGAKGDVFIAISTSGNSKNILTAIKQAKSQGLVTIGFTGALPCQMDDLCDLILKIPSNQTPTIQEVHIMVGHIVCSIVESSFIA